MMDGILVLLRLGTYDVTYRSSIESRPTWFSIAIEELLHEPFGSVQR